MTKTFKDLQSACRKVCATRPNGNEPKAVASLLKHIRDWTNSGEEKPTLLFSDKTHGDAQIFHFGNPDFAATRKHAGNELYQIISDNAVATVTGEQLDSIAKQWLAWRAGK